MSDKDKTPIERRGLFREYLVSCGVSFAFVLLVTAVGSVEKLSALTILLAPGVFLPAPLFPQGIHGDWPLVYLGLMVLIDVLLYAWPVLWLLRKLRCLG